MNNTDMVNDIKKAMINDAERKIATLKSEARTLEFVIFIFILFLIISIIGMFV